MKMHMVSMCSGSVFGGITVEMMLFLRMLSVASAHCVGSDRLQGQCRVEAEAGWNYCLASILLSVVPYNSTARASIMCDSATFTMILRRYKNTLKIE